MKTQSQCTVTDERKQLWCDMVDHNAGEKDVIDVCEDRLDIEFQNLCYYPSGKKGESLCVSSSQYHECYYDRPYLTL